MDLSHIEIQVIPIDETNEDMSSAERNRLCRATFGREFRAGSNVCSSRPREYGERSLTSRAGYWVDYLLGNEPEIDPLIFCEMMCSRVTEERAPLTPEEEAELLESWRRAYDGVLGRNKKRQLGRAGQVFGGNRRVLSETPPSPNDARSESNGGWVLRR